MVKKFGSDGKITFHIGRHGTDDVAEWFNDIIPPLRNMFGHSAGKLNFAFFGTLTLTVTGGSLSDSQETYTLNKIALAQGSTGLSNNWWFGGENCVNVPGFFKDPKNPSHPNMLVTTHKVVCTATNSKNELVLIFFKRGGKNPVDEVGFTISDVVGKK